MKEPVGSVRRFEVDEPLEAASEGFEPVSPVTGTVRLMRTNDGILATADLGLTVRLQCGRCLGDVEMPVKLHIEEEYKPTLNMQTGVAIKYDPDDDSFRIDDHHILDLTEAVRQYALTALPMLPLCEEECRGLCPTCGRNRNEGDCDCPSAPIDSPFAVLQGLFANDDERS